MAENTLDINPLVKHKPIKVPIEYLKIGEIEIHFKDEIDISTEIGKLALQHQETVLLGANEHVHYHLTLPENVRPPQPTLYKIEAGIQFFLGNESNHKFKYYQEKQKWKVTIKLIAGPQIVYLIKTDDESYHWSYKQSGDKQKVKLKEIKGNWEEAEENYFNIAPATNFISPYQNPGSRVFGQDRQEFKSLPVATAPTGQEQDLRITPYGNNDVLLCSYLEK